MIDSKNIYTSTFTQHIRSWLLCSRNSVRLPRQKESLEAEGASHHSTSSTYATAFTVRNWEPLHKCSAALHPPSCKRNRINFNLARRPRPKPAPTISPSLTLTPEVCYDLRWVGHKQSKPISANHYTSALGGRILLTEELANINHCIVLFYTGWYYSLHS